MDSSNLCLCAGLRIRWTLTGLGRSSIVGRRNAMQTTRRWTNHLHVRCQRPARSGAAWIRLGETLRHRHISYLLRPWWCWKWYVAMDIRHGGISPASYPRVMIWMRAKGKQTGVKACQRRCVTPAWTCHYAQDQQADPCRYPKGASVWLPRGAYHRAQMKDHGPRGFPELATSAPNTGYQELSPMLLWTCHYAQDKLPDLQGYPEVARMPKISHQTIGLTLNLLLRL